MKILIKNGYLVPYDKILDIFIEEGIVTKIGENIDCSAEKIIDAKEKAVFPGLIDMHCHLREPGFEYKEDIESGSKSAAMGGFTSIVAMPNTNPVIDNKMMVEYVYNTARNKSFVNIYQTGAISKGLQGKELAEMGQMKEAGIIGVTDDGKPVSDGSLMKRALIYANMLNLPVISHAEDLNLVDDGSMNEGYTSTFLGLKGITRAAEESMTARDILIASATNTKVHITHVSTKGAVEIIRQAKRNGIKVTCDTCPHYFTLTDSMCDGYNTNAKMNPPLREQGDVDAIIEGLKDGTIDAIATDHAPHHIDEKNCEFDKALNGIVGFETAFSASYTTLVKENNFSIKKLAELMSINPSKILNLNKGEIKEGSIADITICDLNKEWVCEINSFLSKSKNSPYDGYKFCGKATDVIVSGKIIVENERIL